MKKILFFTLGLLVAVTSFGQDSLVTDSTQRMEGDSVNIRNTEFSSSKLEDATKSEGDSAYIRNDFASAIQIYESLLRKGDAADVYYNLGNSYYKVNEIAKAILNYERALLLQPGNGDIRANLEIARGKTVDKVEAVPEVFFVTWTKALINSMSVDAWASSGATSLLPKFVDNMEMRLKDFENCPIDCDTLETSDVTGGGAELFLYQSGYLTIKGYMDDIYLLGIPNYEVRKALYRIVLPALTLKTNAQVITTQNMLLYSLKLGNLPEAMKCLKALIADVPYSNKKLASMDMEERYRLIMSTIFNAIGCRVEVEKMIATGRIDMVVETTNFIYVLELKLSNNGGVDAAEDQMKAKQYAEPFKADKRKVIALAIELDDMGKGLVDWKEV